MEYENFFLVHAYIYYSSSFDKGSSFLTVFVVRSLLLIPLRCRGGEAEWAKEKRFLRQLIVWLAVETTSGAFRSSPVELFTRGSVEIIQIYFSALSAQVNRGLISNCWVRLFGDNWQIKFMPNGRSNSLKCKWIKSLRSECLNFKDSPKIEGLSWCRDSERILWDFLYKVMENIWVSYCAIPRFNVFH